MAKKKETKVEVETPQVEETVVMEEPVVETPKVEVKPRTKKKSNSEDGWVIKDTDEFMSRFNSGYINTSTHQLRILEEK